jgi:hypothetical protein
MQFHFGSSNCPFSDAAVTNPQYKVLEVNQQAERCESNANCSGFYVDVGRLGFATGCFRHTLYPES